MFTHRDNCFYKTTYYNVKLQLSININDVDIIILYDCTDCAIRFCSIYIYYCNVHTITYIILCIVILLIVHGNRVNDSFFLLFLST